MAKKQITLENVHRLSIPMGNSIYKYYAPIILELATIDNLDFNFVEYLYRDFKKFDYVNRFIIEAKLNLSLRFHFFAKGEKMLTPAEDRWINSPDSIN